MSDFLKFFVFFFSPLLDSPMLLLSHAPNQPHIPAGTSLLRRADFPPAPAIIYDASLCNRLQAVTCLFLQYCHTVSSVCRHCNPVILFCSTAAGLALFILFLFSIFWIFWAFLFFLIKSKYGSLYMAAWNSILLFLTISLIYWDPLEFCPALRSASCCCQLMSLQTHFSAEKCWALVDSLGCSSSPAVSCAPDWQDLDPEGRCFSSLLLKIPLGALSKSLSCLSSGAFAAFLLPVEQKEMLLVSEG